MSKVKVVAENVNPRNIVPEQLTTDCHTVIRKDGVIDVVRAYKMVDIFNLYYDLGVCLQKIQLSGGVLNPKTQSPEVQND